MNKEFKWPDRLFALDVSRGVASLVVVLWHWQHFAYINCKLPSDFDRSIQPFYSILKICFEKGYMAVDYFFLLSGFIFFWLYQGDIDNKLISFQNFLSRRFSRLYPLHLITLFLIILLQKCYISLRGYPFVYANNDFYHFILNIAYIQSWGLENGNSFNAPTWSVSVEIFIYLIFFIISYLKMGGFIPRFLISVIFLSGMILTKGFELLRPASIFFWGGIIYQTTYVLSKSRSIYCLLVYLLTTIFWLATLFNIYFINFSYQIGSLSTMRKLFLLIYPSHILFSFTVCSLALLEIRGFFPSNQLSYLRNRVFLKKFSWVGDITYSSYLLHFPLQLLFGIFVGIGLLPNDFYTIPISLLYFYLPLILLSYFMYSHIERPIQKFIRRLFKN